MVVLNNGCLLYSQATMSTLLSAIGYISKKTIIAHFHQVPVVTA